MKGNLILEDGTIFQGESFGAEKVLQAKQFFLLECWVIQKRLQIHHILDRFLLQLIQSWEAMELQIVKTGNQME